MAIQQLQQLYFCKINLIFWPSEYQFFGVLKKIGGKVKAISLYLRHWTIFYH